MRGSVRLSFLLPILLCLANAKAQNSTEPTSTKPIVKVGWENGPNQRGSLTLIWSCMSTVIASTWTILHLNIPGRYDGVWVKIRRKTYWMLITILFPEFIFSKAVSELQMAVDDLHAMKEKGAVTGWDVDFGSSLRFLRKAIHFLEQPFVPDTIRRTTKSTNDSPTATPPNASETKTAVHPSTHSYDPALSGRRIWTLTHSYFANMGGLERYKGRKILPLTSHALVNCCVGSDHDPLPTLTLQKEDIEDKAKADWFLKSIAVAQISWLILSVIVRAAKKLPISQLEICTTAFAVLAIFTYLANWSKPKDVGTPVRFRVLKDTYQCEAYKYNGVPFFSRRLLAPSENFDPRTRSRIANDFVRLEGHLPPMAINMAVATIVFGGLHCLAWNFEFPTKAELGIWMGASVASATLPTFTLIINAIVVSAINRAIRERWEAFHERAKDFDPREQAPWAADFPTRGGEQYEKADELFALNKDLKAFLERGIHHQKFMTAYKAYKSHYPSKVGFNNDVRGLLLEKGLESCEVNFLLYIILQEGLEDFVISEDERLKSVIRPFNRASAYITIVTGILYVVIRLTLLALAFAALRSVPEGVYTSTWTRFLPNIS